MRFSPRSMTDVLHEVVLRRAPQIADEGLRRMVIEQERDRFDPLEDQPTRQCRPVPDPRSPDEHATDASNYLAAAVKRAVATIAIGRPDLAEKDLNEAARRASVMLLAARPRSQS